MIRCENGTDFVGTKLELQSSLSEMAKDKISHLLQNSGTNWVTYKSNSSSEGEMGGVLLILSELLNQHGTSLNNESLIAVLTEVG